jgi:hypothetical protein
MRIQTFGLFNNVIGGRKNLTYEAGAVLPNSYFGISSDILQKEVEL